MTREFKKYRGTFDEVDLALETINNPELINDDTDTRLICLVRFYKNYPDPVTGKKLTVKKIKEVLYELLEDNYDGFSAMNWHDKVNSIVNKYSTPDMRIIVDKVDSIHFNYTELEKIKSLNNPVEEKVMFMILFFTKLSKETYKQIMKARNNGVEPEPYTTPEWVLKEIEETRAKLNSDEMRKELLMNMKMQNFHFGEYNKLQDRLAYLYKLKKEDKCFGFSMEKEKRCFELAGFKYNRTSRDSQRAVVYHDLIEAGFIDEQHPWDTNGRTNKTYIIVNIYEEEINDGIDVSADNDDLNYIMNNYIQWRNDGEGITICERCGRPFEQNPKAKKKAKMCPECRKAKKKEQDKSYKSTKK